MNKALAGALGLALFSQNVYANPTPVNSNCPSRFPGHVWSDFFMHRYSGGAPAGIFAGLTFKDAKALKDRSALGPIDVDACYQVQFHPQAGRDYRQGWASMHLPRGSFFTGDRPTPADFARFKQVTQSMDGLPGNPALRQINVAGVMLTFDNKTGLVRDSAGNRIGQLQCYLTPDNSC